MAREVFATYMGGGRFEVRQKRDREALDREIGTGDLVKATIAKSRSERQTQFFYAWVREVYANLPETCPETFHSWKHLRDWMLYKTGNAPCVRFKLTDYVDKDVSIVIDRYAKRNQSIFFEFTQEDLIAYIPESTRLDGGMDHETFTTFFQGAKELASMLIPGLDLDKLRKRVLA